MSDAEESAIQHPDRRCLFFAEEKTGVQSETVNEYDDMNIVVCEDTRDVVVKPVNAVKSRSKLCREHGEHLASTGEWEYVSRQKKLVADGGTVDIEAESGTDSDVVDTFEANGETVYLRGTHHGTEKHHVRVEVSETQTVMVQRWIRNPLTDRRHDLTKLSDDGYLKPFLAVQGKLSQNVVDLGRSPVICLDKDRWEVEERDGQFVAVNQSAEGRFPEMVLGGEDGD